jgi:hypothetical protein
MNSHRHVPVWDVQNHCLQNSGEERGLGDKLKNWVSS